MLHPLPARLDHLPCRRHLCRSWLGESREWLSLGTTTRGVLRPPRPRYPRGACPTPTPARCSVPPALNEREDSATQERGKVGSIGKVEERCVHYARACDNFHVTLCSGVLGRTACNSLRNIASQGRSLMKTHQFPVNITNRIAYGMSALAIGGRGHLSAAEWSLGTGDFPQTSEEQFDSYRPSNGPGCFYGENGMRSGKRLPTTYSNSASSTNMPGQPTPSSASGPNFGTGGAKNFGRSTARFSASCVRKLLPMTAFASSLPRPEPTACLGCACHALSIWKTPTNTSSET